MQLTPKANLCTNIFNALDALLHREIFFQMKAKPLPLGLGAVKAYNRFSDL